MRPSIRESGRANVGDHYSVYRGMTTQPTLISDTPLWRLAAVVAAFGALGCLGYAVNVVDRVDDAATVLVVILAGVPLFWATRRPDRLRLRLGPFAPIAESVVAAKHDIDEWVHRRTVLAGVLVFGVYGIALVLAKHVLAAIIESIVSPWLAAAFGLALGALVVAPDLWRAVMQEIRGDTEPAQPGLGFEPPQ